MSCKRPLGEEGSAAVAASSEAKEKEDAIKQVKKYRSSVMDLQAIGRERHAVRLEQERVIAQRQQQQQQQQQEEHAAIQAAEIAHKESERVRIVHEILAPLYQATRDIQQSIATVQRATSVSSLVLHLQNVAQSLDANYSQQVQETMPSPEEEPLARDARDQLSEAANALLLALDSNHSYVVRFGAPEMVDLEQLVLRIGTSAGVAVELGQVRMHVDDDARLAREAQAAQDSELAANMHHAEAEELQRQYLSHEQNEEYVAAAAAPIALPPPPTHVSFSRVSQSLVRLREIHDMLQELDSWDSRVLTRVCNHLRLWHESTRAFWPAFCQSLHHTPGEQAAMRQLTLARHTKAQLQDTLDLVYKQMDRQDDLPIDMVTRGCIDLLEPLHRQLVC
jgi:hypothetical protein